MHRYAIKDYHTTSYAYTKGKTVGANSNMLTVDLHIEAIPGGRSIPKGQQLQFQMDTFRRVIRENLPHRGMSITFIHGFDPKLFIL